MVLKRTLAENGTRGVEEGWTMTGEFKHSSIFGTNENIPIEM